MKRTTIMLPDDLNARLRQEARRQGSSIAEVTREALEARLPPPAAGRPLSFFSIGEGEPEDASERVDELVREALGRRHPTDA